jgi:hypothetical protein
VSAWYKSPTDFSNNVHISPAPCFKWMVLASPKSLAPFLCRTQVTEVIISRVQKCRIWELRLKQSEGVLVNHYAFDDISALFSSTSQNSNSTTKLSLNTFHIFFLCGLSSSSRPRRNLKWEGINWVYATVSWHFNSSVIWKSLFY